MTVAADRPRSARKTLAVCGGAHALHDGFTDLLNVLYPLLQAQFGLNYAAIGWRQAMMVTGAIAVAGAGVILATLQSAEMHAKTAASEGKALAGQDRPWAFWLLFFIHIADSGVRSGFLIILTFLLRAKGADLPTIGFALSLLFAGGAAGKLAMGWVGSRLGVVTSVVLTEAATTALILALLPLALTPALMLLPLVGLALNGTSSVLYGTIPEFVRAERRTHAFAVFYTGGSIAGAASPFLFGILGDAIGLSTALACVSALALLTVPLVWALRPAFRSY